MNKDKWQLANIALFAFMGICALLIPQLGTETRVTVLIVVAIYFYTKYRGINGPEKEE